MKKNTTSQTHPRALKQKLMSALAMLMIATILMTSTTYAWFVLSTKPEVTGIETQVGANGSLEIVLLNTQTKQDMSSIRAGLGGGSLQEDQITANNAWGNLVDLGFAEYGLGNLVLMPARLDVSANGESFAVDLNKLLAVPSYGFDGRIIELTRNTATAIYKDTDFMYSGGQDYGVRAIGTSDVLSPQGSALASAKNSISTHRTSAKNSAVGALTGNASGLIGIILQKQMNENGFTDDHKATVVAMIDDLDESLTYIDLALRQGLVAYAASEVGDVDTFNLVRNRIMNTETPLADLLNDLAEVGTVPAEFSSWVAELAVMQNDLNKAKVACDEMTGGSYTWGTIKGVMEKILNVDLVLVNGKAMGEGLNEQEVLNAPKIEMMLVPGSGLFADLADFVDNYNATTTYIGKNVEMLTATTTNPTYLAAMLAAVNKLAPADGGDESAASPLDATYGYAIDLAFRCNAAMPDLCLQTAPDQRIYNGEETESANGSTQGGGSYMAFTSLDENFTLEQQWALMDAVRVAFVDDKGEVMAIAKLHMTTKPQKDENGVVKAPLYLYDYAFEKDELSNGMVLNMLDWKEMTDAEYPNRITELTQNVAKAVTVVVWLDGDIVDNTMVSASQAMSLDGTLNLQFATSAELVPAVDGKILEYTPDKSGLEEAVLGLGETYKAGQGTYTNVSWNAFAAAYARAQAVNENTNASHVEVRHAVNDLQKAFLDLAQVNTDAVKEKAEEIRDLMGTTDESSRYVITDENGAYIIVDGSQTDEEKQNWNVQGTISGVNTAEKNLNDEGNGIYTTVYSDESWNALANALYQAEAVAMNPNATENEINAALSALEAAQKALTRQVYYAPYQYNGALYYMAICESDAADTYGRWYDANFKRVVADVSILKLDAYAEPVAISRIGQELLVASDATSITPDISFLEEVFTELRDVQVKGVKWDDVDEAYFTELMHQYHHDALAQLVNMIETDATLSGVDVAAAHTMITAWENPVEGQVLKASDAEALIATTREAIISAYRAARNDEMVAKANMTSAQRIMLSNAVNNGKAVEGYKDTENKDFDALRKAVADAEALLSAESVTGQAAIDALVALNSELGEAGVTASALVQVLPEGFNAGDIVYDVQYPGIELKLTGKSGSTTLGATILTQDGVVIKVSKEITIYDKADGVKLTQVGAEVGSLTLNAEETADILAELLYKEGGMNTGIKPLDQIVEEKIKTVTWASEDMKVATVTGGETGTITAVGAGATKIVISVETEASNVYTLELPVIVNAPANP